MSSAASPYRLDQLGWLQFDRLASLVLTAEAGLNELHWHGHSDTGRLATVEEDVSLPAWEARLCGPVTVVAAWIGPDRRATRRLELFEAQVGPLWGEPHELLLVTNLDASVVAGAVRGWATRQGKAAVVLGAAEIAASLDRHAWLRAAMPSLLGLRDLRPLLDGEARARSTLELTGAQALARVFWPTRAYARARAVLHAHRFVVLTGPPEMGKTAIAQMLALAQLTDGWEAHECNDPEHVWRAFDRRRHQLFIADDAFGSTEYRPDAAERWAGALGRLLPMLDADHWLIWTSRPAPLKAGLRRVQRERGSERFPSPGQVLVDASDLDLSEKTLILFRHAKAAGVSGPARALVRSAGLSIVEHPHFTPERIRRFVSERLEQVRRAAGHSEVHLLRLVERELAAPTEAMQASFRALGDEHRELLISLLDAPAGLIDERTLAATVRRHHAGGLSRPPAELIDRLTDHFLRVTPLGIGWVHPSWRDLVLDELRADAAARRRFIETCGVEGVMVALSRAGGGAGERSLPLLVDDADWDALGDRLPGLVRDLEDQELARVLLAFGDAVLALPASDDPSGASELRSLAGYVLAATRRAWDETRRPLAVFLLEAWYDLRLRASDPIDHPRLAPTWAELHPGTALFERPERAELARADDWLGLAEVLKRYDRQALEGLGFYARDRELLERLIVWLTRASADEELRPLVQSVLTRIERLVPELAAGAHSALEIASLVEGLGRRRWWVPEDIPAPPTHDPVAAGPPQFERGDVRRVLRDL